MFMLSMLSIFLWNISLAEWVDMPQFSDEKRVYRIPSFKQDQFYKFSSTPANTQFLLEYDNASPKDSVSETTIYEYTSEENSYVTSIEEEEEEEEEEEKEEEERQEKITDCPIVDENGANTEYYNESVDSDEIDILKYLPINVLRSVHQTLKSQSTSSEGKLLFLKTFEQTLINEIESRLAQTVKGSRQKRGTEHHHDLGYDSHDNATGFPSIEGALMAISFLTFAVYLVRLVMVLTALDLLYTLNSTLLFRNMSNPAPTPTVATLLLGRRKRSINILDEETVKILSSMDKFV